MTDKIYIGIDDNRIELTGADKENFLVNQETRAQEFLLFETKYQTKQNAKESVIKKLADITGLTEEELKIILN
jgi:hypothetical protein